MTKSAQELCLPVTRMGAAVQEHLSRGDGGTVVAVLSGATYLRTSSREILWIASEVGPMHRRCLKVATALPKAEVGAHFCLVGRSLKIVPGVILDLAASELWQPRRTKPGEAVSVEEVPGRVRALAAGLDLAHACGFGRFIPWLVHDGWAPAAQDDPVLDRAAPAVQGICEAFRQGREGQAVRFADALVGLGAGLTPSGDDFLGGMLFAVSLLRATYSGSRLIELEVPIEWCRARTHPISYALLSDHAAGHALAPLHAIADGILAGGPIASVCPAVLQLLHVGHSTGWDMLAGLFAGLLATDRAGSRCA